jgi:hypothetical protein
MDSALGNVHSHRLDEPSGNSTPNSAVAKACFIPSSIKTNAIGRLGALKTPALRQRTSINDIETKCIDKTGGEISIPVAGEHWVRRDKSQHQNSLGN